LSDGLKSQVNLAPDRGAREGVRRALTLKQGETQAIQLANELLRKVAGKIEYATLRVMASRLSGESAMSSLCQDGAGDKIQ
jgi:hypothetical protein